MHRHARRTLAALACALGAASAAPVAGAAHPVAAAHAAAASAFSYLALPKRGYVPDNVVRATDGALWFDAQHRYACGGGRICTAQAFGHVAGGRIAMYRFAQRGGYTSLSAGPGGTAWISAGTQFFVYGPSGTLQHVYDVPSPRGSLSLPQLGSDGRMWFTDFSNRVLAMSARGTLSAYLCENTCGGLIAGGDGTLWGVGLTRDYQEFVYSVTANGTVVEYPAAGAGSLVAGPGANLWAVATYQIDHFDRDLHPAPFANLQRLGLDQVVRVSAADRELWFVGTRSNLSQAVAGTIGLDGTVRARPFDNPPCRQLYVYTSALVHGSDGAMYGGYGCGNVSGTDAGYLVRIAP